MHARAIRGQNVEQITPLLEARADSVTLGRFGDGMTLNLTGGGSLSLSQIYRISQ